MKHTECKDCELNNGDCGYHFVMDGVTNYDIASLSACDQYGNCEFFKSKAKPKLDYLSNFCEGFSGIVERLNDRPQGEWVYGEDECGQDGWFCSECGFFVPWYYEFYADIDFIRDYKVCPHCISNMITYTGKDRGNKP